MSSSSARRSLTRWAGSNKRYEVPSRLHRNDSCGLELQIEPSTSSRTPAPGVHGQLATRFRAPSRARLIHHCCPVPGDLPHAHRAWDQCRDSLMVVRIPARRRSAAAAPCHNPLYRKLEPLPSNLRLKLAGYDRFRESRVFAPWQPRTVVQRPCAGGRVARSLRAIR